MTATFYVGDALEVMATLPEKSVDLVLSSPPFLALRSYLPADHPDKHLEGGSQATPGAYIDWLIDVVEACARILAPHGSLCFELGDTYAGSGNGPDALKPSDNGAHDLWLDDSIPKRKGAGWPLAKSLSLIPELFRYTLVYGTNPLTGRQTGRWRLRNVIRWVRPNPPVGALGDKFRPATSELMVFCKSAKRFFDLDAVREPYSDLTLKVHGKTLRGETGGINGPKSTLTRGLTNQKLTHTGAPPLDWWSIRELREYQTVRKPCEHDRYEAHRVVSGWDSARMVSLHDYECSGGEFLEIPLTSEQTAPPLDWWNIPPGGYEGAHYAVWPPELCIKPIKAMCPEKVCRQCGEPSRRIAETTNAVGHAALRKSWYNGADPRDSRRDAHHDVNRVAPDRAERITLGFSDCSHNNYRPGLILDPFVGSGTTLAVATGHGRDAIGIDLDERNYQLALERVGPLILERAS